MHEQRPTPLKMPQLRLCPANNACSLVRSNNPACGEGEGHLSPLSLGEQLCPNAAQGRVRELTPLAGQWHIPYYLGSAYLDLASITLDKDHWQQGREWLERGSSIRTPNMETPFKSMLLLSFFDKFKERRETGGDIQPGELNDKLARLYNNVGRFRLPEEAIRGLRIRLAMTHFFLRLGLPLYPGNARESQQRSLIEYHHHGYLLPSSLDLPKQPVRFSIPDNPSERVTHITYNNLARRFRATAEEPMPRQYVLSTGLDAVKKELNGHALTEQQTQVLTGFTNSLQAALQKTTIR